MLWAERRCARGGVHERSELSADTPMAMGALWQRGQRGSTHGRSASEAVERTRGARWWMGPGMRKRRSSRWRMRLRRERGEEAKRAELAMRATLDVEAGNPLPERDRKSTRLNSSHSQISYAVFCLKKKK